MILQKLTARELRQLVLAPRSLTRSLFVWGTTIVLLGMLLISVAAVVAVSSTVNYGHDVQLRMGARMLLSLMGEELSYQRTVLPKGSSSCAQPLLSAEDREAFSDFARWRMFRVRYGGKICWESHAGQGVPDPVANASGQFSDWRQKGQDWRYYTYAAPANGPIVQVGEPVAVRQRIVARIVLEMIVPFMLIALTLLGMLLLGLGAALQGLRAFSNELASQNDRPPFRRLASGEWPQELAPLVKVADGLFERIEGATQRERRFVDMAAHQLRTPLAALVIEAQLAARTEAGPDLRARLTRLHTATHRVAGLVDQLLALAQIEGRFQGAPENLSVRAVLSPIVADIAPIAALKRVEVAVEGDDMTLHGDETALHLLLANLIGNAVKHTGDDSEVVVELNAQDRKISVIDTGPGLSGSEKMLAFERFWKADGNHKEGAGLGLAIVQEAADALGVRVLLKDRYDGQTGLWVEIIPTE